ncbi:MAG: hypothetical protein DME21_16125, partial [Verrucomicrobia bacterium]
QKFPDQQLRVDYEGKVAGDEIKFTRTVAESIRKNSWGNGSRNRTPIIREQRRKPARCLWPTERDR